MTELWPAKLVFRKGPRELAITLDNGQSGRIAYKRLREESPSAENKGHGNGPPPPRPPIPDDISVTSAEPVGRYAVRISFSDGHKTGLYTWTYLAALAGLD